MITKSNEKTWRSQLIHLVFYLEEEEEPVAYFQETDLPPIPEEGSIVKFDKKEISGESPELSSNEVDSYVVDDIQYEYSVFSYSEEDIEGAEGDAEVDRIFTFVNIKVTPIEDSNRSLE